LICGSLLFATKVEKRPGGVEVGFADLGPSFAAKNDDRVEARRFCAAPLI
jgi:hypothetical protein